MLIPRSATRLVAFLVPVLVMGSIALTAPTNATPSSAAAPRSCGSTMAPAERSALIRVAQGSADNDLDDVQQRLDTVARTFNAHGDARGTFPLVYRVIVDQTDAAIAEGSFADEAWAQRLAVRFAQEFFDNLVLHLQGHRPSGYWAEYYRLAADCEHNLARVVAQGIVTHLVDDLPRVLGMVGTRNSHKGDYDTYGQSLVAAAPDIVTVFDQTYGVDISQPLQLWLLGDVFGTKAVNNGLFGLVRTFAWINHLKLQVSPPSGHRGIALTWVAGSGAIGLLEHIGLV